MSHWSRPSPGSPSAWSTAIVNGFGLAHYQRIFSWLTEGLRARMSSNLPKSRPGGLIPLERWVVNKVAVIPMTQQMIEIAFDQPTEFRKDHFCGTSEYRNISSATTVMSFHRFPVVKTNSIAQTAFKNKLPANRDQA